MPAGIEVATSDISVASRILGQFPEALSEAQRVPDNLAELGKLTLKPEAAALNAFCASNFGSVEFTSMGRFRWMPLVY